MRPCLLCGNVSYKQFYSDVVKCLTAHLTWSLYNEDVRRRNYGQAVLLHREGKWNYYLRYSSPALPR